MRTTIAALAAIFILPGAAAIACAFHSYTPAASRVDYLLESSQIVFAKPRPENPYQFEPVRAVRGTLDTGGISFIVENETLRQLGQNSDASVLFARDPDTDEWREIAYVGEAERDVVEEMLARLADWQADDPTDRFQFFADHVDHESPTVRNLALLELDQAPYGVLRSLNMRMSADGLLQDSEASVEGGPQPIRILLLGLTGEQAARTAVRDGLERLLKSPEPGNLGAYATALIESEGAAGVDLIAERILDRPDAAIDAKEQVLGALALQHLHGGAPVRDRIAALLDNVLARDLALAGPVARQFRFHGDWSQAGRLQDLVRKHRLPSLTDQMTVVQYIGLASDFGTVERVQTTGDPE